MNQASLYHRASAVQRRDSKQIFQEYMKVMQWRADEHDTLIDIGSGSGNVLMEYIYPMLPAQFNAVLATDISERMIDFARKNYGDSERAHFEVLDITCAQLPQRLCGQFDHVTSFYCLHWVQNQKRALLNIYQLLRRSGGDCLLVFLANNPIFDVYIELSKSEKWGRYMTDAVQFISPLHNSSDPGAEYSKLLQEAGFVNFSVEIRNEIFVYDGTQNLKDNVKAVCPFLERMPETQHEDFLEDVIKAVVDMKLREGDINARDFKFIAPYKLVVVYARKPNEYLSSMIEEAERLAKGLN
ncbi:juvenile hormone acid O-methyltransferase-like [Rhagoletis pomonella]|uniref:juvenile hormone acid O-methyltransferase-like n=1 Tax=Rhagoletis pomonella TaxID=28610 RepID=UPI00177F9D1F|nr:juvenile hormone acid O-methyltransferase-like [Rhagoletis pomonella]